MPPTRSEMLLHQLRERGIRDVRVLGAMARVPREMFVCSSDVSRAYEDHALMLGHGQTISQPYIVALMTEALALRPTDRVLEVGTGSGYSAAVLAQIAKQVFTIERIPELATEATERLITLGYHGVTVRCGDGSLGWPEYAPYNAIAVTACAPSVPHALLDQLAIGGRLVMPVSLGDGYQQLIRIDKLDDSTTDVTSLGGVVFVPLIGEQGFHERRAS